MGNRETRRRLAKRAALGAAALTVGVASALGTLPFGATSAEPAGAARMLPLPALPSRQPGYQLVTDGGDVLPFGTAPVGSAPAPFATGVAGVAWTADGGGHWLATRDGGVYTFGGAEFFGSAGDKRLTSPVVGIAATRSGRGYWLASADGGVFTFGDAKFRGGATIEQLTHPVVGIAVTATGRGYWLASADGGVFTFGDAKFRGGLAGRAVNSPIVGLSPTRSGKGYWLAAADGGVFSFGDAPFLGSSGGGVWGRVVGIAGGAAEPKADAPAVDRKLSTRFGHDISWPQCDDPYPAPGYGYGIVGITGGRPFRANPCLASQWQWALAHGSGAGVYVNLAAPSPGEPAAMNGPAGTCAMDDLPCQFYNHSANNMLYALDVASRAGVDAPMWWLDVEVLNHWHRAKDLNALVVKAAIETLHTAEIRVGIYSTYLMWRRITGDAVFGLPIWVAGAPTDAEAPAWCDNRKAFNGGQTWLVQSLPIRFDNNWACDPVVADPASVFAFRD